MKRTKRPLLFALFSLISALLLFVTCSVPDFREEETAIITINLGAGMARTGFTGHNIPTNDLTFDIELFNADGTPNKSLSVGTNNVDPGEYFIDVKAYVRGWDYAAARYPADPASTFTISQGQRHPATIIMQERPDAIVLDRPKSTTHHTFAPVEPMVHNEVLSIDVYNYTGNAATITVDSLVPNFTLTVSSYTIQDGSFVTIEIRPALSSAGIYSGILTISGPGSFNTNIALKYGMYTGFINNQAQLNAIRNDATTLVGTYLLNVDIPLTGTWAPIGTDSAPFLGTFDGNGKTISGLTIVSPSDSPSGDYQGLFGYIGGTSVVKNLSVVGNVTGRNYIGGVVGKNFEGIIQNCHSNVVVVGDGWAGGVVGENDGGSVLYSYSAGSVTGNSGIGGVVGRNWDSNGMVQYCYSEAVVVGNANNGGGIVGYNTAATLQHCVALNPSVTRGYGMADTYGRVASVPAVGGGGDPGNLNNNHARDNMVFIPEPSDPYYAFNKTPNGKDGADLTMAQAGTRDWWTRSVAQGGAGWTVHENKNNAHEGSPWYWAGNRPRLWFQ